LLAEICFAQADMIFLMFVQRYGMNLNGYNGSEFSEIIGNYITKVERAILFQSSGFSSTALISGNVIEEVTVGVRTHKDGFTITGNTFSNINTFSTTPAAIRLGIRSFANSRPFDEPTTIVRNNLFSNMISAILVDDPNNVAAYDFKENSFIGITTSTISVRFNQGGCTGDCVLLPNTVIDASNSFWGSSAPNVSLITEAGTTVTTSPFITSYEDDCVHEGEPGFWPWKAITSAS